MEAFGAWAVSRVIGSIAPTPGGIGFVESDLQEHSSRSAHRTPRRLLRRSSTASSWTFPRSCSA